MGNVLVTVAMCVTLGLAHYDLPIVYDYMPLAISIFMIVIGIEIALNFVDGLVVARCLERVVHCRGSRCPGCRHQRPERPTGSRRGLA